MMLIYGCVTSSQLNPPAFYESEEIFGCSRKEEIWIAPVSPGEGGRARLTAAVISRFLVFSGGLRTKGNLYFYHKRRCSRRVRPAVYVGDENDTTTTIKMPTEETLGPRKTMIVLVIVVGCFAVLWPRILSPLILGSSKDQLKPNQFDRDAGCCEVLFNSEIAILEVLNEVCNSVVHVTGKLSPYAAAECRKTVNDTCGVDIVAFLKRDQNVGKSSKQLLDMMKSSNSSCLKEHFGVPVLSLSTHPALNSWSLPESIKQERPTLRGGPGPHPAMRERGRAIPPGAPTPPSRGPIPMPAHMRPPPIPGMRPPLGSPGGPVTAPKSSMGFVMPIYTICIIVFFVYTLSKILFKRTASPYDQVSPDPQFRRRVFRDDSRTSPDKLGDIELEALRARLADTERAMQRIVGQLAARDADVQQDNQARSYTNGTILHNTGPVHIFTSEYQERVKEKTPEPKETTPEPKVIPDTKEASPDPKETSPQPKDVSPEPKDVSPEPKDVSSTEPKETSLEHRELTSESLVKEALESNHVDRNELLKLLEYDVKPEKSAKNLSEEFLNEARIDSSNQEDEGKKTTELLEEALIEDLPEDQEGGTVRVLGMEVSAHAADGGTWPRAEPHTHTHAAHTHKPSHKSEQVSSIFLQTEIPQQSRVLVADFAEDRDNQPAPIDSPLVVSGKMTLSLIQDEPRDTPDRDIESTVDDFTTASGMTQPVTELTEKQEDLPDDDLEAVQEEIDYEEHDLDDEANEGKELVHDEQDVVEPKLEEETVHKEEAVNIEESVNEENNVDEEVKFEEEVVDDKQYLEEEAVNMEVSVNTEMDVNEKEKFEKEVVEDQQDIEEEADVEKEEVEELEEADIEKDLVHEEEFEEEIEEEVEVEEIEVEVTDSEEEDPDEHNKFTKSNNK